MRKITLLNSCLLLALVLVVPLHAVAKDIIDKPRVHDIGKPPAGFQSSPNKVAVVLMHGKINGPEAWLAPLTKVLKKKGYWVVTPLMPWADARNYDAGLNSAHTEIATIVKKLRAAGATKIFVGGHSKGATMAAAYAAKDHSIQGVILISPGHIPESPTLQEKVGHSIVKAWRLVKKGKGDKRTSFADLNVNKERKISTSARIYLSYFDVAGGMNLKEGMSGIGSKTAIFWSIAKTEISYVAFEARSRNYIGAAPANPLHMYYESAGGHLVAPTAAKDAVANWIEKVSKR